MSSEAPHQNAKRPGKALRGSAQNARIFNRDGWKCVYCGFEGGCETGYAYLELDHLDPTTKISDDFDEEFGTDKVTCCAYCNKLKSGYRPQGQTREERLQDAKAHLTAKRTA